MSEVEMPKVGEICFFYDDASSLEEVTRCPENYGNTVAEFFRFDDGLFITRDKYAFDNCVRFKGEVKK